MKKNYKRTYQIERSILKVMDYEQSCCNVTGLRPLFGDFESFN